MDNFIIQCFKDRGYRSLVRDEELTKLVNSVKSEDEAYQLPVVAEYARGMGRGAYYIDDFFELDNAEELLWLINTGGCNKIATQYIPSCRLYRPIGGYINTEAQNAVICIK
jgi:hypothetical protein